VRWLKGIGYVVAAMLAIALVIGVGAIISAVLAAIGALIIGAAAIGFVAIIIKGFCEGNNRR
jgi:hypothetical protein